MKRFNRILAALLAVLMLCGPWSAVAEMDVELEIEAQGKSEGVDPETGENEPEVGLELDDGLQLDGVDMPTLDTEIDMEGDLLVDEAEAQVDESVQPNDSDSDFEIDENGVLVKYKGNGGDVVIPDGVKKIGNEAFYECDNLTSVTIPGSVTEICDGDFFAGAFNGCTKLKRVTFSNGLTHIGYYAFYYCASLTSITIPNSVTSIGARAFDSCEELISITIPNSVTDIGEGAFASCDGLTSITIPNSVTTIGALAFDSCEKLTSITIPNSVTSIGNAAFLHCRRLTSVTIPNSINSIGYNTFSCCTSLTNVTIPNSVTDVEKWAFDDCPKLNSVAILAQKNKHR